MVGPGDVILSGMDHTHHMTLLNIRLHIRYRGMVPNNHPLPHSHQALNWQQVQNGENLAFAFANAWRVTKC